MYKKILVALALFSVLTVLLAACGIKDSATTSGPTVHMGGAAFIQDTVNVPKGSMLTLVDDASTTHIIQNGIWVNGTAQAKVENGAPVVNQNFGGNDSAAIGPFNTSGTFHLYCTIHPGMNLTVTVQ